MAEKDKESGDAIAKNEKTEGRGVIMEKDDFRDEFQCCVCLDLMYKPVVLACGHISCFWCVFIAMDTSDHSHCPVCRSPFTHFPRVCESMHRLLINLYPEVYRSRAKQVAEEEKNRGHESQQFEENFIDSQLGEVHHDDSSSCKDDANARQATSMIQFTNEKNTTKDDEDAEDTRKKLLAHLQCAMCKQLLFCPVVLNCGHVYCEACVKNQDDNACRCPVCSSLHPNGFPSVCLALHHFLEEYFPEEYSSRKESSTTTACSSGSAALERRDNAATDAPSPSPWGSRQALSVHPGVGCDYCGMCPIVGERYRCKDCVEAIGFDLCVECYRSSSKLPGRFNQQHTPEHKFEVVGPISSGIVTLGSVGITGGGEYGFWVVDESGEASSENPSSDGVGDGHDDSNGGGALDEDGGV